MDTPGTHSLRLTLKEYKYYDLVVDAADLDEALRAVHERWLFESLPDPTHCYAIVMDGEGEVEELANW